MGSKKRRVNKHKTKPVRGIALKRKQLGMRRKNVKTIILLLNSKDHCGFPRLNCYREGTDSENMEVSRLTSVLKIKSIEVDKTDFERNFCHSFYWWTVNYYAIF